MRYIGAPRETQGEVQSVSVNFQVLGSTFLMIFLAELGDKTQLSTFAFASQSKSPLSVFLGASLALVCSSFLGVVLGGVLGRFVPERIMKGLAAVVFLGFGVWTLVQAIRG
jgi:putative Ca2+/H+ antiporter (TMEM165/GDT1 family)